MEHKTFRRGPALASAAAFGLAASALMAPAAHAGTEADRPEEFTSATTVQVEPEQVVEAVIDEVVGDTGDDVAGNAGNDVAVEEVAREEDEVAGEGVAGDVGDEVVGDEVVEDNAAVPGEAEANEEATPADGSELCVEAVVAGTTGDGPSPADTATFLNEGSDGEAGLPSADLAEAEPAEEGTQNPSDCEEELPATGDDDEKQPQLPVGGVDAGVSEAASQNTALPIAAAGAAAAAIGFASYALVRRSRSNA